MTLYNRKTFCSLIGLTLAALAPLTAQAEWGCT